MKNQFVVLLLTLVWVYAPASARSTDRAPWVEPARRVRTEAAFLLSKKFGLQVAGVGGSMPDGVRGLSLDFEADRELSKDEARNLLVRCIEDFLQVINQDVEIRPYLSMYPFSHRQVDVAIASPCRAATAKQLPYLSITWIFEDKICYGYDDESTEHGQFKEVVRESYEEARAMVMGEVTNE